VPYPILYERVRAFENALTRISVLAAGSNGRQVSYQEDKQKPPLRAASDIRLDDVSASNISKALDSLDVADGDFAGAAIFLGVKSYFLTLNQSAQARALKRSCMHENILATAVRLDEAEPFLIVVELHNTRVHRDSFRFCQVHVSRAGAQNATNGPVRCLVRDLNVRLANCEGVTARRSGQMSICST
jgi:hypothetical protein